MPPVPLDMFIPEDEFGRASEGGVGRPGVGIASMGTLVGGFFVFSGEERDVSDREDADELVGESREGVDKR